MSIVYFYHTHPSSTALSCLLPPPANPLSLHNQFPINFPGFCCLTGTWTTYQRKHLSLLQLLTAYIVLGKWSLVNTSPLLHGILTSSILCNNHRFCDFRSSMAMSYLKSVSSHPTPSFSSVLLNLPKAMTF